MKQYTSQDQTAKLIELGFEKPQSIEEFIEPENDWSIGGLKQRKAYSIGELIEILPKKIEISDDEIGELEVSFGDLCMVYYTSFSVIYYDTEDIELIDALYDMIVKLKEEGVI